MSWRTRWQAVLLMLAGACGSDGTGIRGEPIRVGVLVSTTGGLGSAGPHLADAAILAAREINAAGGLLGGRRVELLVRDDRTDPREAVVQTRALLDEGAVAIVGALSSGASLAVQEVTFAARVPQISCCSTSPDLSTAQPERDRYFFRTVPSDSLQAAVVARYAQQAGCESLAVLHQSDSYGEPLGMGIEERFAALGGRVAIRVPFVPGRSSYGDEVARVAAASPPPDCVALVAFTTDGGQVLRDWSNLAAPPEVLWIGTDGVKDPGFVEAAGSPRLVDGVRGTAPITDPGTRFSNAFAASYEATFSEPPSIFGGNQYDAVAALLLAIEAAGSTEGVAVREALYRVTNPDPAAPSEVVVGPTELANGLRSLRRGEDIDYEGASGPVNIDAFGDTISSYEIWRYDAASESFVREEIIPASEVP